ncbi:hypothetical protein Scep_003953 [Stephania cephalantha]|uniref:Uncharacterized protein n=1 Tax=Stephania cephalantha TaxID=152367 RepID=A0AAP0KUB2_9MAGN
MTGPGHSPERPRVLDSMGSTYLTLSNFYNWVMTGASDDKGNGKLSYSSLMHRFPPVFIVWRNFADVDAQGWGIGINIQPQVSVQSSQLGTPSDRPSGTLT